MNCPHWSPVRVLGSPRGLWRRDKKFRVLVGGVLLGRGAAVRALLATCAPSPCPSKVLRKPEAFPLRGLSPPRTERDRGVASVGRCREKYCKLFSVRETRVKRQSVCTEWKNGFFGDRTSANSRIMVPHRAERVWGVVHIGSKIRVGKSTVNSFGSGGPESMYASQSSPSEIIGCLGEELQQAVV